MDKTSHLVRLKPDAFDYGHTGVKVLLNLIPIVGSSFAELLSTVLVPPISKRRDEWIEEIAKGLQTLEERVEDFEIESLSTNEVFVTTLLQATQSAIRTHQAEKLEALRNTVLNAALPNAPEDDQQTLFVNYVDVLTTLHLRILKYCNNPDAWYTAVSREYPDKVEVQGHSPRYRALVEILLPDYENKKELFDQCAKDLFQRGLTTIESIQPHGKDSQVLGHGLQGHWFHSSRSKACTTVLGQHFLKFIECPFKEGDRISLNVK